MKLKAVILSGLCVLLSSGNASAEYVLNPADLIEVNAQTKPRCVEYFYHDGKQYCSLKPLVQDTQPGEKYNFDRLIPQFDNRKWVAAWGKNTPNIVAVEYIVEGDNINSWKELVTAQFLPGLEKWPSPLQLTEQSLEDIKSRIPTMKTKILSQAPNDVLSEFSIAQPAEMAQNELKRVFSRPEGLYLIHYVIKQPDMGATRRAEWINLLKQATPKQSENHQ